MPLSRVVPVLLAALLAGCGSFGAIGLSSPFGHSAAVATAPEAITPAPAPPVETSALPPPGSNAPPSNQMAAAPPPGADTGDATGATTPPASSAPSGGGGSGDLSRTDLLGGWTVAANGESCQLFMTLTSWTGGYRASTRGCNSDALKSISAWNLDGRQVVLAGASGAPLARLAAAGSARFDGQIEGGSTISFYR